MDTSTLHENIKRMFNHDITEETQTSVKETSLRRCDELYRKQKGKNALHLLEIMEYLVGMETNVTLLAELHNTKTEDELFHESLCFFGTRPEEWIVPLRRIYRKRIEKLCPRQDK